MCEKTAANASLSSWTNGSSRLEDKGEAEDVCQEHIDHIAEAIRVWLLGSVCIIGLVWNVISFVVLSKLQGKFLDDLRPSGLGCFRRLDSYHRLHLRPCRDHVPPPLESYQMQLLQLCPVRHHSAR